MEYIFRKQKYIQDVNGREMLFSEIALLNTRITIFNYLCLFSKKLSQKMYYWLKFYTHDKTSNILYPAKQ